MSAFETRHFFDLRRVFQHAAVMCSERCLYQSAKWIAELANSLPAEHFPTMPDIDLDMPMQDAGQPDPIVPIVVSSNPDAGEARLEAREASRYLLAKSLFDCREYDRCAAVFLPFNVGREPVSVATPVKSSKGKGKETGPSVLATPIPPRNTLPQLSQKSLFLALYAKYMSGEKRKDEESEMLLGPADGGATVNKELVELGRILDAWFTDRAAKGLERKNQGWLEYLYGVVLIKGKSKDDGQKWLMKSVQRNPNNWSAWVEMNEALDSYEQLVEIAKDVPESVISSIFFVYASQELLQTYEDLEKPLTGLEGIFPNSLFLKTQRAMLLYHSKAHEQAESTFSECLKIDPHRIDYLHHYSDILYVHDAKSKLAFLAQAMTATDKFRPETCYAVGNYYSSRSEHEKAVMYFRRALTLDRNFLPAWTLMGHEYMEMKNTHAAIESYRRVVDINRKDHKAWYGLGQTYEILGMNLYALFYFQRAASLRPHDPKMWQAIGSCYDKIEKPHQSIKAYKQALKAGMTSSYDAGSSFGSGASGGEASGGLNPEILYEIALMYEKTNNKEQAAAYMELTMESEGDDDFREDGTGATKTTSQARMWIAQHELHRGNLARALKLANEMAQDGYEPEDTKALIRELRTRMDSERQQSLG